MVRVRAEQMPVALFCNGGDYDDGTVVEQEGLLILISSVLAVAQLAPILGESVPSRSGRMDHVV